ncbi:RNA binding motif protein 12Ba [Morone saxatilis]|uniref:RNA binding motif protein 12Ba n=1 Tax=Morone saxatilis TaxID=34816 RepID=UPI0015E2144B|nr:RNA binding motif protein 12Ba [Morone saxatilis]XP_035528381.1 RNA binding motif protein 12Ba [Morone saxatilis]
MTIILRMQGLDVKAGTEDIRTFFECLHIPDGGVYIVGGSLREAFIAFTTEKDAQLAMRFTGNFLKGSMVTLHISSMDELEQKLKSMLKRKKPSPTQLTAKRPHLSPDANPLPLNGLSQTPNTSSQSPTGRTTNPNTENLPHPETSNPQDSNAIDSSTAFLLGICTILQGLQSSQQTENNEAVPRVGFPETESTVVSDQVWRPEQTLNSKPGYVRLFGLPASATKEVISRFFRGLTVQEVIVNVKLGLGHACLVKFASEQDACKALLFNQQSLGPISVEVRGGTEKMWTGALEECETALGVGDRVKPRQSPLRETANHKHKSTSAPWLKRHHGNRRSFKSPKKPRSDGDSTAALSSTVDYTVMVSNLPKTMTKTEIKELLGCPNIAHKNVLHLLDKEGNRTDTAFLFFNRVEDFDYAMNLNGCHVGSDAIEVSSITKKMMRDMMAKAHPKNLFPDAMKKPSRKRKSGPDESLVAQRKNMDPAAQTYLFVSNMPANVQKNQIKSLFRRFGLKKHSITLLLDADGKGIGEAVVHFKSQKVAALAQRLHGQDFLGAKVLLTCINVKQMEDILARNV